MSNNRKAYHLVNGRSRGCGLTVTVCSVFGQDIKICFRGTDMYHHNNYLHIGSASFVPRLHCMPSVVVFFVSLHFGIT